MAGNRSTTPTLGLFGQTFRKLLGISIDSTKNEPTPIDPTEEISRFVMHSSDIKNATRTIHYKCLIPQRNAGTGRLETSICRSSDVRPEELWAICLQYIDAPPTRKAIGAGVAEAHIVHEVGLGFDPNGKPFAQHADIVGWYDEPNTPDAELKHNWMDKAQRMAPNFKYSPRPSAQ